MDSTELLCVVMHTVHKNFQMWKLLVNVFGVFRAFYRDHFSHDFRAQGVTVKSKASATKCIFQNCSQLLDIYTQLVLKTAQDNFFVPSVHDILLFAVKALDNSETKIQGTF